MQSECFLNILIIPVLLDFTIGCIVWYITASIHGQPHRIDSSIYQ